MNACTWCGGSCGASTAAVVLHPAHLSLGVRHEHGDERERVGERSRDGHADCRDKSEKVTAKWDGVTVPDWSIAEIRKMKTRQPVQAREDVQSYRLYGGDGLEHEVGERRDRRDVELDHLAWLHP